MTGRLWSTLTLLAVLAAACAPYSPLRAPGEHYPYVSDVPPTFYDYDPALRDWYTFPYWHPDVGP